MMPIYHLPNLQQALPVAQHPNTIAITIIKHPETELLSSVGPGTTGCLLVFLAGTSATNRRPRTSASAGGW